MKQKLTYLLIILYILNIWIENIYAEDCEIETDIFKKYQCSIKKNCEIPDYTENKKIFNPEKFQKADSYKELEITDVFATTGRNEKPIKKAISIYKENMNSIYKCAMIGIQKKSLLTIKDKLLKLDQTLDIKKNITPKIENVISRLTMASQASKCLEIADKNTVLNKLSILKHTTQQTCEYAFYIHYLKAYYNNPENVVSMTAEEIKNNPSEEYKSYVAKDIATKLTNIQSDLDIELAHSLKIFPIVFHAYSEYENNFPIHFLLELIKEDYIIFRDKLHAVLNPINQVGYKIINAMK